MPHKFYSYKRISENAVQPAWFIFDKRAKNNDEIKKWKKNADLPVRIEILHLENKNLLEAAAQGTTLAMYVTFHSLARFGGTGLHGLVTKKVLQLNTNELAQDIELSGVISGELIAGSLELTLSIVVENTAKSNFRNVYATEKGSSLYENSLLIHLEGNQALFPVKAIDFKTYDGVAPNALYFLKKKFSPLDSNFNTSYMLYFNKNHPLFEQINSDNENDLTTQYLLKILMYDVYKSIVLDALDENNGLSKIEIDEEDLFSLRSVYSRILSDLISRYFPTKSLEDLQKMVSGTEDSKNAVFTAIQDYIMGA